MSREELLPDCYVNLSDIINSEVEPDKIEDLLNRPVYTIGDKHYIKLI